MVTSISASPIATLIQNRVLTWLVADLLALDRRLGEAEIRKRLAQSRNGRDHGHQSEVGRRQQPRQHHRRDRLDEELGALRGEGQHAPANRPALQVCMQMFGAERALMAA